MIDIVQKLKLVQMKNFGNLTLSVEFFHIKNIVNFIHKFHIRCGCNQEGKAEDVSTRFR